MMNIENQSNLSEMEELDSGWFVELAGVRVAALSKPKFIDMFWQEFEVELLTDDPQVISQMRDIEFWSSSSVRYRNRAFFDLVVRAFAGGSPLRRGQVSMRGLDPGIGKERMLRKFHSLRRRKAQRRLN
jgi:hypothetical protein